VMGRCARADQQTRGARAYDPNTDATGPDGVS
jgi:hypothetical protein